MAKQIRLPTPDERKIIDELNEIRVKVLGFSHPQFHQQYLTGSWSCWHRLNNDKYTGNTAAVVARYARDLVRLKELLRDRIAGEAAAPERERPYYITDSARAVIAKLRIAMNRDDRLVMFLAEPGQGKSALTAYLKREFGAICILGQEDWKKSYTSVMRDIARAFDMRDTWHTRREMREAIFNRLRSKRFVLVIDEGNSIGPAACNAVRDIINSTKIAIVITAIPFFVERLRKKSFWESGQMMRRALAIIPAQPVSSGDVGQFLANIQMNGDRAEACKVLAASSRVFGHYDLVTRVVENLVEAGFTERVAVLQDVEQAIAEEQAQLRITSTFQPKK